MKFLKLISILTLIAAAAFAGWFFGARKPASGSAEGGQGRKVLYYQSSMHPWIKSDKPGNCTICGMKLTPVYEGEAGFEAEGNLIALSSNAITVIDVQSEPATVRALERRMQVAGRIESDETRYRVLSAYVDARVEKLFVNYVGAEVREGEPLARLYSPELLAAEREYLNVLEQAKAPASPQIREERQRLVQAAARRLELLGIAAEQIQQLEEKQAAQFTTDVFAPISGTIVSRNVYEGQYVKAGDKLFEIADLSKMWFRFDVYEQDLAWIRLGAKVEVRSPALGSMRLEGPIVFIDPTINQATRSARVRVELDNPLLEENGAARRALFNGMYAEGMIQLKTDPVLAVNKAAVLQPGETARVYVDAGGGAYEPRVVLLGRRGEEYVEILQGVEEGERVVVNGNLLIDSQAEINRVPSAPADAPAHPHSAQPEQKSAARESVELSSEQQKLVSNFVSRIDDVSQALAADDLERYNAQLGDLQTAVAELKTLPPPFATGVEALMSKADLNPAKNLDEARQEYLPFSGAAVELARLLRSQSDTSLKIYKCPMYPRPGKNAFWVQREGPLRNPFYGSEMLECGQEVK